MIGSADLFVVVLVATALFASVGAIVVAVVDSYHARVRRYRRALLDIATDPQVGTREEMVGRAVAALTPDPREEPIPDRRREPALVR